MIAPGGGPRALRLALAAAGTFWVASIGGIAVFRAHAELVPAPPRFLLQATCLFPYAADNIIDYRVQGFSCEGDRFVDLDHRPYFPVRPDDKESTFERLGHFYRRTRPVMAALDRYLVAAHNRRAAGGRDPGDGIPGPIGGIRFLSLRGDLPPLGSHVVPYHPPAIDDVPADHREGWYLTSPDDRHAVCRAALASPGTP
ncbi:MAG TPA: hypothetical protein VHE35_36780 [Kofleriaceae bacterium]|nr:hypothetical protein [Kofleriaceae bacterium]